MKISLLSAAFIPIACGFATQSKPVFKLAKTTAIQMSEKATLTEETTWRMRFVLNGVPTTNGRRVDELFVVEAQFLEEEGYEPPQGTIRQVLSNDIDDKKRVLEIAGGRWQLSEDPDDRKDGLWVWGLFKEPLYPFMLLQLDTKEVSLPGEENDSIKPLKLYAQISHARKEDEGVVLNGSTLNVREIETVNADPFGGAKVDIYEEIGVGQLNIQPVASEVEV